MKVIVTKKDDSKVEMDVYSITYPNGFICLEDGYGNNKMIPINDIKDVETISPRRF